jgi:hypothetical protein
MADLQNIETPGDYRLRNGAVARIFAFAYPWAIGTVDGCGQERQWNTTGWDTTNRNYDVVEKA